MTSMWLPCCSPLICLRGRKARSCGSVSKSIFQPAEETTGGAQPMIDAGALEEPKVDFAAGFHVNPDLAAGSILAAQGPIMASPDNFYMTLTGKGGHCATPYKNDDLIQAGPQIVSMLSSLCDKFVNPLHPFPDHSMYFSDGRRISQCDAFQTSSIRQLPHF